MAITAAQLDVKFTSSGASQVKGELRDLKSATDSANSGFQKFQNTMLGFGTAMIAPVTVGLNAAIDLEQAMADVNATLGGLDTGTLKELEQGFMDIGAASKFSAVEVAAVGDEIARAGFPTDDIVGMTQAVVDLSQATGADLMTSVSGVTAAMQVWSPAIVDGEIALTDAARAADIFTVAANASSAEVGDIISGMRNFGPTAASVGIGFDEASASIAMFTNYGLKAADSGISLTRAFENLQNPTAEAQALMDEFGLSLFDVNGNVVPLPDLFDQLHTAFADMTPEARNAALSVLFGAEALDVMTIAAMTGGDPLRMILGLMQEQGVAAEQSALRMDTLKAQFGELTESVTNLLGRMMSGLIPGMRGVVDVANQVVNVISRIPQPILAAVGAVMALSAAFATLRGAAAGLALLERLTGIAIPGGALIGRMATPFLMLSAAIGVAYAAIRLNLFGIGDAVQRFLDVWSGLADSAANNPVSRLFISLGQALQTFDVGLLDRIGRGLDAVGKSVNAFWDGFRGGGTTEIEKQVRSLEGFAELQEDGVTWKIKTEGGDEVGEIIDSWDNADGSTTVRIRTEGGEELETTIDMATGFVSEDYEVEVKVGTKDARDGLERMIDGFDAMTRSLERSAFSALARVPRFMGDALRAVDMLTEHFGYFRRMGIDPTNAALLSVGQVFPDLADEMQTAQRIVNDFTTSFQDLRDQGLNPVEAGVLALGATFPSLQTAMVGLYGVVDSLGDAFSAAVQGDWAGAFEGLAQAAESARVVIGEIGSAVVDVAVSIGNWVLDTAAPNLWAWLQDTAIPAMGTAAVAVGDVLVTIGGWVVDAASSVWDAVRRWAIGETGGVLSLPSIAITVAGWVLSGAASVWDAVRAWALGETGGVLSLPSIAVSVGGWIQSGAMNLFEQIQGWVMGETGGVLSLPSIAVSVREWISAGGSLVADFYNWIADTLNGVEWNAVGATIGEGLGTAIRYGLGTLLVGGFLQGELFEWLGTAFLNIDWGGLALAVGAALLAVISGALDFSRGFLSGLFKGLFDPITDELESALTRVKDAFNEVISFSNENFGTNFDLFDTPTQQAKSFEAVLQNIRTTMDDALGGVGTTQNQQRRAQDQQIDAGVTPISVEGDVQGPIRGLPQVIAGLRSAGEAATAWAAANDAVAESNRGVAVTGERLTNLQNALNEALEGGIPTAYDYADTIENGIGPNRQLSAAMAGLSQTALTSVSSFESLGSAIGEIANVTEIPPVTLTVEADTSAAITSLGETAAAAAALATAPAATLTVNGDNSNALTSIGGAAGALAAIDGTSATLHSLGNNSNALASIGAAAGALAGIDGRTAIVYINAISNVGAVAGAAAAALAGIDGRSATTYIDTVYRSFGSSVGDAIRNRASGGTVHEPLTLVGEFGPELVSLPYGSYVHTASETANLLASRHEGIAPPSSSGSGRRADAAAAQTNAGRGGDGDIYVDLSGASFVGTSREEMERWAEQDLIPELRKQLREQRRGQAA